MKPKETKHTKKTTTKSVAVAAAMLAGRPSVANRVRKRIREDDARLIAAAPDLLEACKTLVSAEDQPPENRNMALLIAIEKAIDAIAKAEKGSQ